MCWLTENVWDTSETPKQTTWSTGGAITDVLWHILYFQVWIRVTQPEHKRKKNPLKNIPTSSQDTNSQALEQAPWKLEAHLPNWENTCEEASTLGDEGQCKMKREKSATLGENILQAAAARESRRCRSSKPTKWIQGRRYWKVLDDGRK